MFLTKGRTRSKSKVKILQKSPLILGIGKNGRGVHIKAALAKVLKAYPETTEADWRIYQTDHTTFAELMKHGP